MRAVQPPFPRAETMPGRVRSKFATRRWSPPLIASPIAVTATSTVVADFPPATPSGHSAPPSIHALMVLICSALNGPVGGICCPALVPLIR